MKTDGSLRGGTGKQRIFEGLAVGRGIAIGTVYRHDSRYDVYVREIHIPANRVKREQDRLAAAVGKASLEIGQLQAKASRLHEAAREELGYLLEAYKQMLRGSRLIRGVEQRISTDRINAEAAVLKEINLMEDAFAAMDDASPQIWQGGNVRALLSNASAQRKAVILSEILGTPRGLANASALMTRGHL